MVEVLRFHAPWCSPCRVYARTFFKVMDKIDVANRSINIDDEPEEAKKYNILAIPATVVLKDGEVFHKRTGTILYKDLEDMFLQAQG